MSFLRLIARLDIKGANVIKGIQMDGLRVVGPVAEIAKRYYEQGADEIVMIDTVASLYGRESMVELIKNVTAECFVPVTVGGGIRSLEDADALFRAGADKVALNTAALARPGLITEISAKYGAQAMVIHVEAKASGELGWECYTEAGRQPSGIAVLDWVATAERLGAGEFLVTSVDRDGTRKGMDIELLRGIRDAVTVPVVASSGAGNLQHVLHAFSGAQCDGVAMGAGLHWGNFTISDIRAGCHHAGLAVRELETHDA
jgi:imidazole glycerol-phosphate synthase subunit HisF